MFGPYPASSRPLSGRRTFKTGAVFFLLALHLLAPARAFWKCEPLRIPACAAMPYNVTRMPNLLQQGTQGSAALALHRFELLVRRSCSAVLPFFLCAMYAPICTISFRLETVPPCRDVCERARAGCEPEMRVYNLSWPENLDCKKLPRYDRGVCVSPETILASPPKDGKRGRGESEKSGDRAAKDERQRPGGPNRKGCQCKRKLRLRRKLLRRRRHDFALHVKFNHTITTKKKYAIVVLYTKDIMKDEQSRILPNSIIHLWVKRTCQCSWTKDEEYLILGKYNQKGRLTLSRKSIVTQWRKGWTLLMKKWQTNAGLKKGPAERLNRRQNRRRTKEAKRKRDLGKDQMEEVAKKEGIKKNLVAFLRCIYPISNFFLIYLGSVSDFSLTTPVLSRVNREVPDGWRPSTKIWRGKVFTNTESEISPSTS